MRKGRILSGIIYILSAALLVALDQITKYWISKNIPYGSSRVVIRDFFEISHVRNMGAAWGVMSGRTVMLSAVTVIACLLLIYLLTVSVHKMLTVSLIMVLSGAVGNLIDRVGRGEVIDFLAFHFGSYEFPNFNVADICITCGCVILLITVIFLAKDGDRLFRKGSAAARLLGSGDKNKDRKPHDDQ